jgi:AcrR family transcriptional regulator
MGDGLRERKKAETRTALGSAALRLADELGPDGVTIEAIAEAAGVSPRTFFNYFSSKEDAIVGIAPAQSSALLADLRARPADESPLDALRSVMLAAADRMEASRDEWTVRHRLVQRHHSLAVRRSALFAEVERGLAEEIARRTRLDPDLDTYPLLVVTTAIGAMRVATAVWQERPPPGTLSGLVVETFDVLAQGLTLLEPMGATAASRPRGR